MHYISFEEVKRIFGYLRDFQCNYFTFQNHKIIIYGTNTELRRFCSVGPFLFTTPNFDLIMDGSFNPQERERRRVPIPGLLPKKISEFTKAALRSNEIFNHLIILKNKKDWINFAEMFERQTKNSSSSTIKDRQKVDYALIRFDSQTGKERIIHYPHETNFLMLDDQVIQSQIDLKIEDSKKQLYFAYYQSKKKIHDFARRQNLSSIRIDHWVSKIGKCDYCGTQIDHDADMWIQCDGDCGKFYHKKCLPPMERSGGCLVGWMCSKCKYPPGSKPPTTITTTITMKKMEEENQRMIKSNFFTEREESKEKPEEEKKFSRRNSSQNENEKSSQESSTNPSFEDKIEQKISSITQNNVQNNVSQIKSQQKDVEITLEGPEYVSQTKLEEEKQLNVSQIKLEGQALAPQTPARRKRLKGNSLENSKLFEIYFPNSTILEQDNTSMSFPLTPENPSRSAQVIDNSPFPSPFQNSLERVNEEFKIDENTEKTTQNDEITETTSQNFGTVRRRRIKPQQVNEEFKIDEKTTQDDEIPEITSQNFGTARRRRIKPQPENLGSSTTEFLNYEPKSQQSESKNGVISATPDAGVGSTKRRKRLRESNESQEKIDEKKPKETVSNDENTNLKRRRRRFL